MSTLLRRLLPVAACVAVSTSQAQSTPALSQTERAIVSAVDAHNGEAIALLERIVNINSGTMNFAGVRQVADVLRPQFDALGFGTAVGRRRAISPRRVVSSANIRGPGQRYF